MLNLHKRVNVEEKPKGMKMALTDDEVEMIAGGGDKGTSIPTTIKKPRQKNTTYAVKPSNFDLSDN